MFLLDKICCPAREDIIGYMLTTGVTSNLSGCILTNATTTTTKKTNSSNYSNNLKCNYILMRTEIH